MFIALGSLKLYVLCNRDTVKVIINPIKDDGLNFTHLCDNRPCLRITLNLLGVSGNLSVQFLIFRSSVVSEKHCHFHEHQ